MIERPSPSPSPSTRWAKLPAIPTISSRVESGFLICCIFPLTIFRGKTRDAIWLDLSVVYLTALPSTAIPIVPPTIQHGSRRTSSGTMAAAATAVVTITRGAHHRAGSTGAGHAHAHATRSKRPAAVEPGVLDREGPELVGVRRETSPGEEGGLRLRLVMVLLERGGGEEAEALELLRLAEELHREERVGRRRGGHGVGGGEVGDGRRVEARVHGEGRRLESVG